MKGSPIRISDIWCAASRSLIVIIAASASMVACDARSPASRKLDVVHVARSTFLTNAPILIADEERFFEDEGIRVEYVEIPLNSVQALPGLQRGDVDAVAATMSVGLINGVASGGTFRIVADRGYVDPAGCETSGVIGRKAVFANKPLTAALLRGSRVSTNSVGQSGYMFSRFLARYGLTMADMKMSRLAPSVELQAMENGGLDIVTRSDPYLHAYMKNGDVLLAGARSLLPNASVSVLVYGPSFLERDRRLGLRFMTAYLRGVRQYNKGHTQRNLEVIGLRLGLDTVDLRDMCWPSTRPDGVINEGTIGDYQHWAVKQGHLKEVAPAASLIDMTFAAEASRALDSAARAR